MVTKYGMSDRLGPINYAGSDSEEVFIGRDWGQAKVYSEATSAIIDEEVDKIISKCYADAKKIIEDNMDVLEKCAQLLLEKEKITRAEFEALFNDGNDAPEGPAPEGPEGPEDQGVTIVPEGAFDEPVAGETTEAPATEEVPAEEPASEDAPAPEGEPGAEVVPPEGPIDPYKPLDM